MALFIESHNLILPQHHPFWVYMSLVLRKGRGGKGLLFPQELVLNYWLRDNYFFYSRHTNRPILYQH